MWRRLGPVLELQLRALGDRFVQVLLILHSPLGVLKARAQLVEQRWLLTGHLSHAVAVAQGTVVRCHLSAAALFGVLGHGAHLLDRRHTLLETLRLFVRFRAFSCVFARSCAILRDLARFCVPAESFHAGRFPALCRLAARLPVGLEGSLRYSSPPELTCDCPDARRGEVRPREDPLMRWQAACQSAQRQLSTHR